MEDVPQDPSPMRLRPPEPERPRHPTSQATLLLVGVTLLIIALAVLSTFGQM